MHLTTEGRQNLLFSSLPLSPPNVGAMHFSQGSHNRESGPEGGREVAEVGEGLLPRERPVSPAAPRENMFTPETFFLT